MALKNKKKLKPIEEKKSAVEEVLKKGNSELIAKAIKDMLKRNEINGN